VNGERVKEGGVFRLMWVREKKKDVGFFFVWGGGGGGGEFFVTITVPLT